MSNNEPAINENNFPRQRQSPWMQAAARKSSQRVVHDPWFAIASNRLRVWRSAATRRCCGVRVTTACNLRDVIFGGYRGRRKARRRCGQLTGDRVACGERGARSTRWRCGELTPHFWGHPWDKPSATLAAAVNSARVKWKRYTESFNALAECSTAAARPGPARPGPPMHVRESLWCLPLGLSRQDARRTCSWKLSSKPSVHACVSCKPAPGAHAPHESVKRRGRGPTFYGVRL